MTVLIKSTRTEAAQLVALDRRQRGKATGNYSIQLIEAEELVRALEVLGVVSFSGEERIRPAPRSQQS